MVVRKNYSISNQAYDLLVQYGESEYGQEQVYSTIVIDAVKWGLEPTAEQKTLKQNIQYESFPEYVEPFSFTRGDTKQIKPVFPEDLWNEFVNTGRKTYGSRGVGRYLSRLIYDYCYLRPIQNRVHRDQKEKSQSEWVRLLRENYNPQFSLDELPDPSELNIPRTYRVRRPLCILILRDNPRTIYTDSTFETVMTVIGMYDDVTERTREQDIEYLKESVLVEIPEYTRGDQLDMSAGWFEPENDEALTQLDAELNEWITLWINTLAEDRYVTMKEPEMLRDDFEAIRERFGDLDIDISRVDELEEQLDDYTN